MDYGIRTTAWEERAIKLLLKNTARGLTSTAIVERLRDPKKPLPFNARENVNGKLARLIRKIGSTSAATISISKSERRGPHPIVYRAMIVDDRSNEL